MAHETLQVEYQPLPPLQDKREAKYTQDPELARLMAEKEITLRNNAARKRFISERLAKEGYTDLAGSKRDEADSLVRSAMKDAASLETHFDNLVKERIEVWTEVLDTVGFDKKPSELAPTRLVESDFNNLVTARARQVFARTYGAGEPVTPDGPEATSALPQAIGENKGHMTILSVRKLPQRLGGVELLEGIAETTSSRLPSNARPLRPTEVIWSVRKVSERPSQPRGGGVGGN